MQAALLSGIAMSLIALTGGLTLILSQSTLDRILLPLVAFAAGSLIEGTLFHMIPASIDEPGSGEPVETLLQKPGVTSCPAAPRNR
jgi:zinc transporter ZupT